MVCRSRLLGGSGSQNQMLGGGDAGGAAGNGCWRKDQKWMLEPEVDASRDQGSSTRTDGED